jgi:hypothetical protein
MDTQEVQELEETAAVMADVFLERPGVHTVHLAEVPHDAGGPPYYIGPKYRLIVVVDGELAISYLLGLTCPPAGPERGLIPREPHGKGRRHPGLARW